MVCPMAKMYTLGHDFIPSANHAGGLRYHGMIRSWAALPRRPHGSALLLNRPLFSKALPNSLLRTEGILPAPESSHAIRVAIDEALKQETGEKTIVFGLTGTGYFDA